MRGFDQTGGGVRWVLRVALLLATTALADLPGTTIALAQSAGSPHSFDIPVEPLPAALTLFGRQSGLQVSVPSALVQGRTAAAVSGSMESAQALNRLLSGTGLSYSITGNIVTLSAAPSSANNAIQLGPVKVEGQAQDAQNAYGPGVGYVATRSASATKTDTPLIEVPQSVSVVTQQQMQDQQPQTVTEALRYTPGAAPEIRGVVSPLAAQPPTSNVLLRGFTPDSYLDGLRDNYGAVVDPYLLNRIEVLNGPASVLYGQASPGGFVNMESKLPTATPLHEVQLGLGNYGEYRGAFDLGGPLDQSGQFLYRLTGVGMTENGQVDFTKTQELAIAPAFTWRPDANTSFTLLGKYQNYPSRGALAAAGIPAIGSVLPNPNGKIPTNFFTGDPNTNTSSLTYASIGYQFKHKFNDTWSVQQDFLYQHTHSISDIIWPLSLASNDRTLSRYAYSGDNNWDNILLDNRATARFGLGPIQNVLTFGLDYQNYYTNQKVGTVLGSSIDIFSPIYFLPTPDSFTQYNDEIGTTEQIGVYAQDQITYDHWHLLLGARGDYATQTEGNVSLLTGKNIGTFNYTSAAPSWRAGLVYLFDNGLAPYVSYTTSFQPNSGAAFDGTPFQPTTAQQYEAGVKYQPPGWNSFITAAVYNLTEQNVETVDPEHPGFSTQTGEVRSRGVELSGHADLTDNISLIAAYTYMNAVNTKSDTTGTSITGVSESEQGKRPVGVPAQMASLWGTYTVHGGPARGLTFGAGVRYIGSSYGDAVNSFKVPGFTLVDAMLSYDLGQANPQLKGLKLQVNASNLFNKTYVASCTSSTGCFYGPLRSVYASLTYDW